MQEQKRTFMQRVGDILLNRNVSHYVRPESTPAPAPTPSPEQIAWAIRQNETRGVQGDPYRFAKPSGSKALGRDLGTYQVTEGELKTYAPRYLGQNMTANAFLASSTAQDKYMNNKVQYFLDKGYTPSQIADIHRKGYKNSSAPGTTTYQSPEYVKAFEEFLKATTTPSQVRR